MTQFKKNLLQNYGMLIIMLKYQLIPMKLNVKILPLKYKYMIH